VDATRTAPGSEQFDATQSAVTWTTCMTKTAGEGCGRNANSTRFRTARRNAISRDTDYLHDKDSWRGMWTRCEQHLVQNSSTRRNQQRHRLPVGPKQVERSPRGMWKRHKQTRTAPRTQAADVDSFMTSILVYKDIKENMSSRGTCMKHYADMYRLHPWIIYVRISYLTLNFSFAYLYA
jgi:hypothetical protein